LGATKIELPFYGPLAQMLDEPTSSSTYNVNDAYVVDGEGKPIEPQDSLYPL
jgi:hypothetical protein